MAERRRTRDAAHDLIDEVAKDLRVSVAKDLGLTELERLDGLVTIAAGKFVAGLAVDLLADLLEE